MDYTGDFNLVCTVRLQKNYVPPRKAQRQESPAAASAAPTGSKFSLFKSSSSTPVPAANTPPPPPAATTQETAVVDPEEDYAERKSVAATVYNSSDLNNMGKEQILKGFLGVSVSRGEKFSTESKRVHHAYEVCVDVAC